MADFSRIIFFLLISTSFVCFGEETVQEAEENAPDDGPSAESDSEETSAVEKEDNVHVLTDANFDTFIQGQKIALVEFYAPWCGHCKQLAPHYGKAAKRLAELDPVIPLAKVDCTVQEKTASQFGVQGYPTLKIFRDGVAEDYEGPREEDGIVEHMMEKGDPNYKPPPDAVLTLTQDNFDDITNAEDIMLVEFYAPWCGHCKQLEPKLKTAAKKLLESDPPIKIGKVDATVEKDLGTKFGVSGYPTMKIFRKGVASEYKGQRETDDIVEYMQKQAGDPSKLLSDAKAVKSFLAEGHQTDEPVIVAFVENADDEQLKLFFEANNDLRDDFKFGHTFDAAAKKKYGIKKSCIVLFHAEYLITKYEPKQHVLVATSAAEVTDFYTKNQAPLVGHYQEQSAKKFTNPLLLVFYDVDFSPKVRSLTQFWRNKLIDIAHANKDITFAVADESAFEAKLKEAGRSDSGEDVNAILYDASGRRFALDDEFNDDSIAEFIEEWKAGNLKPILKSQAKPRKQGAVQTVVGDTFDEIVKDESKEVLIEFYAPWCGHCKKLEPIYKKLAEKYKKNTNIVIAKFDATANEGPSEYEATGFPTIFWAPPGKKSSPVKFEGDRSLEGFEKFLTENSNELKQKDEL